MKINLNMGLNIKFVDLKFRGINHWANGHDDVDDKRKMVVNLFVLYLE